MSLFLFGLIRTSSESAYVVQCADDAASRFGLAVQIADRMGNAKFLNTILLAQGDVPSKAKIPFLVAEEQKSNVSQELLSLIGADDEERARRSLHVKGNLEAVGNWCDAVLRCAGVEEVILYFTDGYDVKYERIICGPRNFSTIAFERLTADPYDFSVPSMRFAVSVKGGSSA
jgi:hypothetical protein